MEIQKAEYLKNEKNFLDEINNICHSFLKGYHLVKNKNMLKKKWTQAFSKVIFFTFQKPVCEHRVLYNFVSCLILQKNAQVIPLTEHENI